MKQPRHVLALLLPGMVLATFAPADAYDQKTHEQIALTAAAAADIANQAVLARLGLGYSFSDPLQKYPSPSDSSSDTYTVRELIGRGAVAEDSPKFRALHHFFDARHSGEGLTIGALMQIGAPSPDWALEDKGEKTLQSYSYADTREYFLKALTSPEESARRTYFGKTFEALGHVIHHIADMAQPQHVRNDLHLDAGSSPSVAGCNILAPAECVGYLAYLAMRNPSFYEQWTEDRIKDGTLRQFTGYAPVFSQLDTGTFSTPRKFWANNDEFLKPKGLAQFTAANFLSAGTLSSVTPSIDANSYVDMDISNLCNGATPGCPSGLTGVVRMYSIPVTDNYRPETSGPNPYGVSESIFDQHLNKLPNGQKTFALNRFNFAYQHAYLIPRAVGYSAGLINYFFRGNIDFLPDSNNAGSYIIKNLGSEPMTGNFALYYDAADGYRYPVSDGVWNNLTIPALNNSQNLPNQSGSLTFTSPADSDPSKDGEYVLVFDGNMGDEQRTDAFVGAIAAITVNVSKGALYVLGLDAQENVIEIRANSSGTEILFGHDAAGNFYNNWRSRSGLADPVQRAYAANGGHYTAVPQPYIARQAQFKQSSDGWRYVTKSVVYDDPCYLQGSGNCSLQWVGQSTDPQVGTFSFRLVLANGGYSGSINYSRTYKDQSGVSRTTGGNFSLPTINNNATSTIQAYSQYGWHISSDGFKLCGLRRGDTVVDTFENNTLTQSVIWSLGCIDITQSANPTASLSFDTQFPISTFTKVITPPSLSQTVEEHFGGFIGYFSNELEKWEAQSNLTNANPAVTSGILTLPTGTVQSTGCFSGEIIGIISSSGHNLGGEFRLLRPITNKASDAIYSDFQLDGTCQFIGTTETLFRNIDITDKDYAIDASPLGEMFFAKGDLSVVIHEPKAGGMPRIRIPSTMVRVLSAIWR